MVTVHKIKMLVVGDAVPQRMAPRLPHPVPAHVRYLAARRRAGVFGQVAGAAREHAEAVGAAVFIAVFKQHLQPHADSEKRFFGGGARQRPGKAARVNRAHAVAGGALAGKDNLVGVVNQPGVAAGHDARAFGADAVQRLLDRAQVAHAVIHNGDGGHRAGRGGAAAGGSKRQSTPLVEGRPAAMRGSGSTAMRHALANALNTVSAMWWLLSPRRLSMCSVACAWLTKPWKNS